MLKQARVNKLSVLLTHTHPWNGLVTASDIDREGEQIFFPAVFRRVPDVPHGRFILGHRDYESALFSPLEPVESPLRVFQVGTELDEVPKLSTDVSPETNEDRFNRQIRMLGLLGQKILGRLRVGIVGLGGTGSVIAQELAHLGVGSFLLMDPDVVEATNLNRLVGATASDVGTAKVFVAEKQIRRINPKTEVASIVGSANLNETAKKLVDCDLMFICTDSHGSRAVLNQLSYQYYLPAIDIGVRIDTADGKVRQVTGRAQMIGPGLSCLLCSNLLDPEVVRRDLMTDFERLQDPYVAGSPEPQPSVISINSTVSSLAVSMFLAATTGLPLKSRYQIYRGELGTVRSIANESKPDCVVCSASGASGKGDEWQLPGRLK